MAVACNTNGRHQVGAAPPLTGLIQGLPCQHHQYVKQFSVVLAYSSLVMMCSADAALAANAGHRPAPVPLQSFSGNGESKVKIDGQRPKATANSESPCCSRRGSVSNFVLAVPGSYIRMWEHTTQQQGEGALLFTSCAGRHLRHKTVLQSKSMCLPAGQHPMERPMGWPNAVLHVTS